MTIVLIHVKSVSLVLDKVYCHELLFQICGALLLAGSLDLSFFIHFLNQRGNSVWISFLHFLLLLSHCPAHCVDGAKPALLFLHVCNCNQMQNKGKLLSAAKLHGTDCAVISLMHYHMRIRPQDGADSGCKCSAVYNAVRFCNQVFVSEPQRLLLMVRIWPIYPRKRGENRVSYTVAVAEREDGRVTPTFEWDHLNNNIS